MSSPCCTVSSSTSGMVEDTIMKIAVSSTGPDISDAVDPRFGRAAYLLVVEIDDMTFKAIDNTKNVKAFKGAGIQAATTLSNEGAEVLLTGYCGPNAFKTLKAGGIRVVNDMGGTVHDAVMAFKNDEFAYSSEPNAEGHW